MSLRGIEFVYSSVTSVKSAQDLGVSDLDRPEPIYRTQCTHGSNKNYFRCELEWEQGFDTEKLPPKE